MSIPLNFEVSKEYRRTFIFRTDDFEERIRVDGRNEMLMTTSGNEMPSGAEASEVFDWIACVVNEIREGSRGE